jgi:hypothetical protein
MKTEQPSQSDFNKPVAYDAEGRPLYAHPQTPPTQQTQIVHMVRPINPEKQIVSDEVKLKHDRSRRVFPYLNLSEGEYVISAVKRHPIGLFVPFTLGILSISSAFILLFNYDYCLHNSRDICRFVCI